MRYATPVAAQKEEEFERRALAEEIVNTIGYVVVSPLAGILLWNIVTNLAG